MAWADGVLSRNCFVSWAGERCHDAGLFVLTRQRNATGNVLREPLSGLEWCRDETGDGCYGFYNYAGVVDGYKFWKFEDTA